MGVDLHHLQLCLAVGEYGGLAALERTVKIVEQLFEVVACVAQYLVVHRGFGIAYGGKFHLKALVDYILTDKLLVGLGAVFHRAVAGGIHSGPVETLPHGHPPAVFALLGEFIVDIDFKAGECIIVCGLEALGTVLHILGLHGGVFCSRRVAQGVKVGGRRGKTHSKGKAAQ